MQAKSVKFEERREMYSLPEGHAYIVWPSPMSESSIQDLEEHLKQFVAKLRRVSLETVPPAATTDCADDAVEAARNTNE